MRYNKKTGVKKPVSQKRVIIPGNPAVFGLKIEN
jgi:hypothetical protein